MKKALLLVSLSLAALTVTAASAALDDAKVEAAMKGLTYQGRGDERTYAFNFKPR